MYLLPIFPFPHFPLLISHFLVPTFRVTQSSHLLFRIEVKILPIHDVSAIGLKLEGVDGVSMAELFPSSLIPAVFQARGIVLVTQQQLKRSMSAAVRFGHLTT